MPRFKSGDILRYTNNRYPEQKFKVISLSTIRKRYNVCLSTDYGKNYETPVRDYSYEVIEQELEVYNILESYVEAKLKEAGII